MFKEVVIKPQENQNAYASAGHHAALLFADQSSSAIEQRTANLAIGVHETQSYQKATPAYGR